MKRVIEDYINGNLTDSKRIAKRYSLQKIVDAFMEHGYGLNAAYRIAKFLKGRGTLQAACDAEYAERQK